MDRPWQLLLLCLSLVGEISGGEPFEGHPKRHAFGKATAQTLLERLALEPKVQIRFCGQRVGDCQSSCEDLIMWQNLVDDSPSFSRPGIDGLARPQQPFGPSWTSDLFPDHLETIASGNAKGRMREVTIGGALGRNMHVCQEQILRVDGSRTVGDPNDWHGKIDQALEDIGSLTTNFLPVCRLEDLAEAGSINGIHKDISRPGDQQRPVVLIERDLLKSLWQVFVGLAGEGNWSAVGMETQRQDAIVRTLEGKVFVASEVT